MKNAHKAVIYVSRTMPTVVAQFEQHGNPAVRKAAEHMRYIAGMADQETARQHQSADDALFYLPLPQIDECLALSALR